jgi:phage tail-like protein
MPGKYPPTGFHFRVNFGVSGTSDDDSRFQEVTGIEAELDTITYKEGGENRFSHTLPVRGKYPNLVLKRGLITNSNVAEWCRKSIEDLDIEPVSIQVSLLNENHEPLRTWNFINAWPKKWSVSGLNAMENRLVIESMEIVYQYFRKV